MTDPALSAELARFLGVPGTAEIIVRVVPPADNWLLDVVAPGERSAIQRRYFEEQLAKLQAGLRRTASVRSTLYSDRGEAAVAGPPEAVYELVRPGGAIERNPLLEVLSRIRFNAADGN
jgi:hypothetical protein